MLQCHSGPRRRSPEDSQRPATPQRYSAVQREACFGRPPFSCAALFHAFRLGCSGERLSRMVLGGTCGSTSGVGIGGGAVRRELRFGAAGLGWCRGCGRSGGCGISRPPDAPALCGAVGAGTFTVRLPLAPRMLWVVRCRGARSLGRFGAVGGGALRRLLLIRAWGARPPDALAPGEWRRGCGRSRCSAAQGLRALGRFGAAPDGKNCAPCMIRGVCAAKRPPSWQDLRAVHSRKAICRAFRIHGAHILPSPARFGYMARESCHEGALFPSEALFRMHGVKKLPRIAARGCIARISCHRRVLGNA